MAGAERRKTSGNEARTARTIRLTARVEFKLQRIAEGYGVDLNAAVSIAVVHAHAAMVKEGLLDAADPGGRRP